MEENSEAPELMDHGIPDFTVGGNSEALDLIGQDFPEFTVGGNSEALDLMDQDIPDFPVGGNSEALDLMDQDIPEFTVGGNSEALDLMDQNIPDFSVSGNMHDTAESSGTKAEIQPQPDDTKRKANYALDPGPDDDSVLYNQKEHVTSAIWEREERGTLACRDRTSNLEGWLLTEQQKELVTKAGFEHLMSIPAITLNKALVSALVERWRKETNTFHMTVGEMTITLEDVALLLGLRIDGKPVTGNLGSKCDAVCLKYLDKSPGPKDMSGRHVKLSWLRENFSACPEDASEETILFHTRAYLLYLVGSSILSTTAGDKVSVAYLQLFENFEDAGTYAWGAAALSVLYRALGNATFRSQTNICGSMTLLQCWSYYRLKIATPDPDLYPIPGSFPLARRWHEAPVSHTKVQFYRNNLDNLTDSQVVWCPYDVRDSHVPENIREQVILGRSKTVLICFGMTEMHLPDRCLRQFGMRQNIPAQVERRVRRTHGRAELSSELEEWENRHLHIVEAGDEVDESLYKKWYFGITRRWVGRLPEPLNTIETWKEIKRVETSTDGMSHDQRESVKRIQDAIASVHPDEEYLEHIASMYESLDLQEVRDLLDL